jgi:hypothetical protein
MHEFFVLKATRKCYLVRYLYEGLIEYSVALIKIQAKIYTEK